MKEFEKAGSEICPECKKRIYFVLNKSRYLEMECPYCGIELEILDEKEYGSCYYCYPRGDIMEKRIYMCELCKKWFCEKHINAKEPMSREKMIEEIDEYQGHPCVGYVFQEGNEINVTYKDGVTIYG